jgi:MFS family permease
MGWTSPFVLVCLIGGVALLWGFFEVERRVQAPMFDFDLFKIRSFTAGNFAGLLGAISRGGLQFMLIIWLQGIWLPLHGYSFEKTPLWAGIYMLPMTAGFLISGPTAGWLSDRFGARLFATGGMLLSALSFGFLMLLPANFGFPVFALLLLLMGISAGMFAAPNTAAIMNAAPARQRGEASGMRATFANSGTVLSIGVFFSLLILGLAASLPHTLLSGLTSNGVPAPIAQRISHLPPVGTLFAAFLGYNPIKTLLGPQVLSSLPAAKAAYLTGPHFFPSLISSAFIHGLRIAFGIALLMSIVAAWASWLRDDRYVHDEFSVQVPDEIEPVDVAQI